ncbi:MULTISPECIES: recombinase family protein [unclassified Bradyrhizobium]|uniref:recombinase family protein n=1 Tax=unclassified Bradyrhizobium TaxID=2631580 RepID=UPI001FF711CA|nr:MULTISPECIES: recombinase family protein [unclassified Bradyrhizobium]MCK1715413.1 recombinase family protein [Bradyrhizobium sp. 143]MCK1726346.1 recombinase family protein [Bradyrhizobium sp. 142]
MSKALIVHRDRLPQTQKMHRAAQYVRMSTDYQQYSIENQAAVIATYAELHKLTIVRTYCDEGQSGLKIENRQGLTDLIDDVRSGDVDFGHLLVFDVSRWGRFQDVDESAHYEFICRKAGLKVAYCAEQFDNDSSLLSSIVKNIKRVMAAEFSRELSGKVHAGAMRLASLGFKMGGPAPFGLERQVVDDECKRKGSLRPGERKFLTTDRVKLAPGAKDQVDVIRWIFDEYLRGTSQRAIARELNRCGVPTNGGGPWRRSSISMLLRQEAYVGTAIYNRGTKKLGAKRTPNPRELWVRSEGAIEAIVDRDVFIRASKALEQRCVRISKEQMLVRLRKILMKKGKLSAEIINATPGLPSITTYLKHFGTVRNLYRLIGYSGKQDYWNKLDAHKRWVDFQLKNAAKLKEAFESSGRSASIDVVNECLHVENCVSICFRIAKWRMHVGRPIRWTVARRVRRPRGWIVALRLGENNEAIFDYVLMPSSSLSFKGPVFWFSEASREPLKIERFGTFEELSRALIKRVNNSKGSIMNSPLGLSAQEPAVQNVAGMGQNAKNSS